MDPFEYHGRQPQRVPAALSVCTHIFLRIDAVRRPLTPPYEGPFRVLDRGPKTFVIDKAGKSVTVTIDRLKPAMTLDDATIVGSVAPPTPTPDPDPVALPVLGAPGDLADNPIRPGLNPREWPLPTRSGRFPKPVHHLGV